MKISILIDGEFLGGYKEIMWKQADILESLNLRVPMRDLINLSLSNEAWRMAITSESLWAFPDFGENKILYL